MGVGAKILAGVVVVFVALSVLSQTLSLVALAKQGQLEMLLHNAGPIYVASLAFGYLFNACVLLLAILALAARPPAPRPVA